MKTKTEVQRVEITGIICDICGDPSDEYTLYEYVSINHLWGYYSNKDGTRTECDICESCFDKIKDFIVNTLEGEVREISTF